MMHNANIGMKYTYNLYRHTDSTDNAAVLGMVLLLSDS